MKLQIPQIKEKPLTIVLIVLAIAGLTIFLFKFYQDTKFIHQGDLSKLFTPIISESKAIKLSQEYLINNNLAPLNLQEYKTAVAFYTDDAGQSFLAKTQGVEKANDYLIAKKIPTFDYIIRFYKELETEEFNVQLDAETGEINGFSHTLPEDKKIDTLTIEQAEKLGFEFLTKKYEANLLEKKDQVDYKQPNRTDYAFTYKIKNSELQTEYGESYANLAVTIQGNQIGGLDYALFVPENFGRQIAKQLASGALLSILSGLASVFIYILTFIIMIRAFIKKTANWKVCLYFSLAVLGLLILELINSYPLVKFGYATETTYLTYLGIVYVMGLIALILGSGAIFIGVVAGEALGKDVWPEKIVVVSKLFKGEFFSKELGYAALRGYLIAFISLGATSLLYIIGEKYLGVWSLNGSEDFSTLLNIFPPLTIFTTILLAALTEELLYRLIGITFFRKHLKSTFLAVLITTVIWAVAHSSYPVFPYYFRAIELTVTGLFFGYMFVRYNVTTMISAHYLINGFLLGTVLFFSGRLYLEIFGVLIVLLPLIIGLLALKMPQKTIPAIKQTPEII